MCKFPSKEEAESDYASDASASTSDTLSTDAAAHSSYDSSSNDQAHAAPNPTADHKTPNPTADQKTSSAAYSGANAQTDTQKEEGCA